MIEARTWNFQLILIRLSKTKNHTIHQCDTTTYRLEHDDNVRND
uniref:Uncharacterized protein n=1 Tax=Schistosoma curassoni TaxID=6186 RepID=A0A183JH53_9TREM